LKYWSWSAPSAGACPGNATVLCAPTLRPHRGLLVRLAGCTACARNGFMGFGPARAWPGAWQAKRAACAMCRCLGFQYARWRIWTARNRKPRMRLQPPAIRPFWRSASPKQCDRSLYPYAHCSKVLPYMQAVPCSSFTTQNITCACGKTLLHLPIAAKTPGQATRPESDRCTRGARNCVPRCDWYNFRRTQ